MNIGDQIWIQGPDLERDDARVTALRIRRDYDLTINFAPVIKHRPADWGDKVPRTDVKPSYMKVVVEIQEDGSRVARAYDMFGLRVLKDGTLGSQLSIRLPYERKDYPFWLKELLSRFEKGELS